MLTGAPPLTPERQQMLLRQITTSIKASAMFARRMDPLTHGRVSHAAFCGGLESIMCEVFRQTCGEEAGQAIAAAFTEAFDDTAPDAAAIIAQAERAGA